MLVLNGLRYRVDHIAFADDGQMILATSLETNPPITVVWPLSDVAHPQQFPAFAGVAFGPDGKFILGEKRDRIGRIDLPPSRVPFTSNTPQIDYLGNLNCIQLSPDRSRLVASKLGHELLWWTWPGFESLSTWALELCGQWTVADLAFSPDGASIAVFQHDGLTLHDTLTGQIRWTAKMKANTNFGCVSWSPDGRLIAAGGGKLLRVFDSLDGSLIVEKKQSSKYFLDAEFTRDGRFLATVSNEDTVKFFDAQSWNVRSEMAWQVGGLKAIAFSRDGTLAAAGGSGKKVVVWDLDL
jgi:WD40 repeat protein